MNPNADSNEESGMKLKIFIATHKEKMAEEDRAGSWKQGTSPGAEPLGAKEAGPGWDPRGLSE